MVDCEPPFMKVQSIVDHCIVGATQQLPKAYLATMPPCWAKMHGYCVVLPSVNEQDRLTHINL